MELPSDQRFGVALAAVCTFVLHAGSLSAEPVLKLSTDHYLVSGDTPAQIRRALNARSPVEHEGHRYDAFTDWSIDWYVHWYEHARSCEVTGVDITLTVEMTLPRLDERHGLTGEALSEWKRYRHALLKHENGHKAFGWKAAKTLERRLPAMEPRETCQRLMDDAQALFDATIEQYARLERQYDRRTDFGRTQGAVFPPAR